MDATRTRHERDSVDGKRTKTSAVEQNLPAASAVPLDGPAASTEQQNKPDGDIHPPQSIWSRRQQGVVFDGVADGLGRDGRSPENVVVGNPVGKRCPCAHGSAGRHGRLRRGTDRAGSWWTL